MIFHPRVRNISIDKMKNKYDEYYNFRLASATDVDNIMKFIASDWNSNHILAKDKEFFLWQYGRSEYGDYEHINVVLMTDKKDSILGIIGFIAYSNDVNRFDISPAITKVKSEGLIPLAGIEFMKRQMNIVGERHHLSYGTNPNTIKPIYKNVFHYRVGQMQQFYMLNDNVVEFKIASIGKHEHYRTVDYGFSMNEFRYIDEVSDLFEFTRDFYRLVYKSKEYINKRYFQHPVYDYRKWIIRDDAGEILALLFAREIVIEDRKVLRIVDYRGELENLYKIGHQLKEILHSDNYEYIDLISDNLSSDLMKENGFLLLNQFGENVIPNYFEPFVPKNIVLHYENDDNCVIFKADGDQDRPNSRS